MRVRAPCSETQRALIRSTYGLDSKISSSELVQWTVEVWVLTILPIGVRPSTRSFSSFAATVPPVPYAWSKYSSAFWMSL